MSGWATYRAAQERRARAAELARLEAEVSSTLGWSDARWTAFLRAEMADSSGARLAGVWASA